MPRATSTVAKHRSRKRVLKQAKGYVGGRSKLARTAKETVMRAMAYAYRDRKNRKRDFRALWITRINAASRQRGLSYSRLIEGLNKADFDINRKTLADLAVHDEAAFDQIVALAKNTLS